MVQRANKAAERQFAWGFAPMQAALAASLLGSTYEARLDRFIVAHLDGISGGNVASRLMESLIALMKMSSIERAARAFALAGSGVDEWDTLDAGTQERLKEAVRAALRAIREPSASATRAGARKSRSNHRSSASQATATWQAMIDATVEDR
jgi:hypothetical protein